MTIIEGRLVANSDHLGVRVNEAGQILHRRQDGAWKVATRFLEFPASGQRNEDAAPVAIVAAWISTGYTSGFGTWLAVVGVDDRRRVFVVDLNPGGMLARWWYPAVPGLATISRIDVVNLAPIVTVASGKKFRPLQRQWDVVWMSSEPSPKMDNAASAGRITPRNAAGAAEQRPPWRVSGSE